MVYKNLIKTVEQRKELEDRLSLAKAQFEESIAVETAMLNDLREAELTLRNEILLEMKTKNLDSVPAGNYNITRNIKYTNQIKDVDALAGAITQHRADILKLGINPEQLTTLFATEVVVKDKKLVSNIVDNYQKVENVLLPGCERKATEFITVAKK